MRHVLAVAIAYLIGSVPFAFLLARRRGVDLRTAGSGNIGATNVLRTSGVPPAVVAVGLDVVKGAVAVLVAQRIANETATAVLAGLASMAGHVYPIWLRFHGGKGVATAAGVFAVLMPYALGIAMAVFVIAVWATRYVSVGSIAAAVTLVIVAAVSSAASSTVSSVQLTLAAGATVAAALIVHRHRSNIARVLDGTERKI